MPPKAGLSDYEKLKTVEYLTEEHRWPQFRIMQSKYFKDVQFSLRSSCRLSC